MDDERLAALRKNVERLIREFESEYGSLYEQAEKILDDDLLDDDLLDDDLLDDDLLDDDLLDDAILVFNDKNGNEVELKFLELISYNGDEFMVFLPVAVQDGDRVVILKVGDLEDDKDDFIFVEDEKTLTAVYEIFKEKYKDKYDRYQV